MPIYAYRCRECGEKFELVRGMLSNDDDVICPKCGAIKPQRVISSIFSRIANEVRGNFKFPT